MDIMKTRHVGAKASIYKEVYKEQSWMVKGFQYWISSVLFSVT